MPTSPPLTEPIDDPNYTYNIRLKWQQNDYKEAQGGFHPDAEICGLSVALRNPSMERAKILWGILIKSPHLIKGVVLHAKTVGALSSAQRISEFSKSGKVLAKTCWMPDQADSFRKPNELFLTDLPATFDTSSIRAKEVADKLGMKRPVSSETIEALGFSSEDELRRAQAIVQSPDEFREFEEFRRRRQEEANSQPALPNKISPDPKRREEKIAGETHNTPEKTQETRERTVDPEYSGAQGDARAYLKYQYTDDDGVMFCQLCQAPQPVMLNGEPHFEAVDCVGGINTHHKQNNLALCPNHAAMYKNGGLADDTVQLAVSECKSQKIPLNLAGNQVELYFTQQHLGDIRALLDALNPREI